MLEGFVQQKLEGDFYVVFVTNEGKKVAIWAHQEGSEPLVWDYHVILVRRYKREVSVYDMDSFTSFPTALREYLDKSFRENVKREYLPVFRVVGSEEFLCKFSSDRSHMLLEGEYISPPPVYPPIQRDQCTTNLFSHFVNVNEKEGYGTVMTLPQFVQSFSN